jgi:hypothetical protein
MSATTTNPTTLATPAGAPVETPAGSSVEAPAGAHAGAGARAVSLRWIIGARDDLLWFIGSVASSYALFALYVGGIVPLVPMVAAWAILIDAPHVFGTFSRTYFDREERRARGRLLWGSLAFFAVGPLMVVAGLGLVFFFLAALWAYYHLVKQHYGFMVLYKKKNADLAPTDNALDRLFILLALTYPFVAFVARDAEALARVPPPLAGWRISKRRCSWRPSVSRSRGCSGRCSAPSAGNRSTCRNTSCSPPACRCTGSCSSRPCRTSPSPSSPS